jgi:hypothetical protein
MRCTICGKSDSDILATNTGTNTSVCVSCAFFLTSAIIAQEGWLGFFAIMQDISNQDIDNDPLAGEEIVVRVNVIDDNDVNRTTH